MSLESVQALANRFMPLGAVVWGVGIAFVWDILKWSFKTKKTKNKVNP